MPSPILDIVARAATSTDLFTLADISAVRNWDYSLPTLTKSNRFTERKPWTSSSSFQAAFDETYPFLKDIKLDHLALVGGTVLGFLTGCHSSKDLDLYVVTDQPNLADAAAFGHDRVQQFIHDVYTFMSTSNDALRKLQGEKQKTKPEFKVASDKFYQLDRFRVRRVRNVYTVEVPQLHTHALRAIHLCTTPHATLPHLLQRADIMGIAYYEGDVHFTELAKFCFENLCFVVDGSLATSPTYIDRVIKYFDRGFDVILPALAIANVRTANFEYNLSEVIALPQLLIVVNQVKGNKVSALTLRKPPSAATTDATSLEIVQPKNMTPDAVALHNIACLVHNTLDGLIVDGDGPLYANSFRPRPYIPEHLLVKTYETVRASVYTADRHLSLRQLAKYFTVDKPSAMFHRLVLAYVASREEDTISRGGVIDAGFDHHVETTLDAMVHEQIQAAKAKLAALEATRATSTTDDEEATIMKANPEAFFGAYFRAP
ncbi:Aste57867_10612 [Aphanomyces stellatus]|uniref:Aste57867_10612 protein n=1 Tax=Aphanomyces stellatus TaxID=120398 RepID=A0A485KSD0_9STRA|nr:hypothetical protein As57867_010572 [Aphanomyces stellatus]VFT87484.1 Aste57867_10612 [Aphanomyces stellatus]